MSYTHDPNEPLESYVKLHRYAEVVIETCHEHSLKVSLVKPELNSDSVTLQITATKKAFRAAQLDWLRRMSIGSNWNKPTEEELI